MSKPQIGTYGFCDVCGDPHTINGLCKKHQPSTITGLDEQLTYGFDKGSRDGDHSALSIKKGKKLFVFVDEEAEAIHALLEATALNRVEEAVIAELQKLIQDFDIDGEGYGNMIEDRIQELTTKHKSKGSK